jgi:hypothetical protein
MKRPDGSASLEVIAIGRKGVVFSELQDDA